MQAAMIGHADCVRLLVEAGADKEAISGEVRDTFFPLALKTEDLFCFITKSKYQLPAKALGEACRMYLHFPTVNLFCVFNPADM